MFSVTRVGCIPFWGLRMSDWVIKRREGEGEMCFQERMIKKNERVKIRKARVDKNKINHNSSELLKVPFDLGHAQLPQQARPPASASAQRPPQLPRPLPLGASTSAVHQLVSEWVKGEEGLKFTTNWLLVKLGLRDVKGGSLDGEKKKNGCRFRDVLILFGLFYSHSFVFAYH